MHTPSGALRQHRSAWLPTFSCACQPVLLQAFIEGGSATLSTGFSATLSVPQALPDLSDPDGNRASAGKAKPDEAPHKPPGEPASAWPLPPGVRASGWAQ